MQKTEIRKQWEGAASGWAKWEAMAHCKHRVRLHSPSFAMYL